MEKFTREQTRMIARTIKTLFLKEEKDIKTMTDTEIGEHNGKVDVVDALTILFASHSSRFNCNKFRKECGLE